MAGGGPHAGVWASESAASMPEPREKAEGRRRRAQKAGQRRTSVHPREPHAASGQDVLLRPGGRSPRGRDETRASSSCGSSVGRTRHYGRSGGTPARTMAGHALGLALGRRSRGDACPQLSSFSTASAAPPSSILHVGPFLTQATYTLLDVELLNGRTKRTLEKMGVIMVILQSSDFCRVRPSRLLTSMIMKYNILRCTRHMRCPLALPPNLSKC